MKKLILFMTLVVAAMHVSAQITINRSDLVVSGQTIYNASDSNKYTLPTGGANKTWNFSSLKVISKDTIIFNPPQWYTGNSYFPSANLATNESGPYGNTTFYRADNTEFSYLGSYETTPDTFYVNQTILSIITFPSTYNTSYGRTSSLGFEVIEIGFDFDSTGPLPFIDSLRIKSEWRQERKMIGWGSLTTPLGTYNTLLQDRIDIVGAKYDIYANNTWIPLPKAIEDLLGLGNTVEDTNYQHMFWTNDATVGFPLMSYDYEPNSTEISDISWLFTKPVATGVNHFSNTDKMGIFPNPCHAIFNVKLANQDETLLNIYDMNGRLVKNLNVSHGSSVDISELANGFYTVKYISLLDGSTIGNVKLVKN